MLTNTWLHGVLSTIVMATGLPPSLLRLGALSYH